MVDARCIKKYRDNNNVIVGYLLQDENGVVRNVSSQEVKYLLSNNKLHIINLKLTSDNRIVDDKSYTKTDNVKERLQKLAAMITKDTGIRFESNLNVVKRSKKDMYIEAITIGNTKLRKIALTPNHNIIRVAYLALDENNNLVNSYKHLKYDKNGYHELIKLIH